MKISRILITSVSVFTLLMLSGCEGKGTTEVKEVSKETSKTTTNEAGKQENIDMHGGKENASMQKSAMAVGNTHSGTVIEVIDADPYTYANVKTENGNIWVAVPRADIKKDIKISFNENMRVVDFESKTLGKTFDVLIFANEIQSDTPIKKIKPEHPHKQPEHNQTSTKTSVVTTTSETVDTNKSKTSTKEATPASTSEGVTTVAEVYAKKSELNEKTIKVVGKVVKVSAGIMGKNWIHIQDGTGVEGTNDLLFTSPKDIAEVGDEVVAEGKVAIDQDLGYGYFYSVLIEESTFSKK